MNDRLFMFVRLLLAMLCLAAAAAAATLEKLDLETMIARSTSIVRGKIGVPAVSQRGPLLYTMYPVAVSEVLKGTAGGQITVGTPGGNNGRIQQSVPGAPLLSVGEDCVLFLWTGRSGLTQILGFSQGLFTASATGISEANLTRKATTETMVDPHTRQPVSDEDLTLRLSDLRTRIRRQADKAGPR